MPDYAGAQPRATENYLTQAREAMELAERTRSVLLREELLKLAMKWLRLADQDEVAET